MLRTETCGRAICPPIFRPDTYWDLDVQTVAVSSAGRRPVSWRVPEAWADHVISYVPDLDLYLDAGIPLDIQNKSLEQERFHYEMGLNLATGEFGVIR